jgi:hypothetical protein
MVGLDRSSDGPQPGVQAMVDRAVGDLRRHLNGGAFEDAALEALHGFLSAPDIEPTLAEPFFIQEGTAVALARVA